MIIPELWVHDLELSTAFYCDLVGLDRVRVDPDFVVLGDPEPALFLSAAHSAPPAVHGCGRLACGVELAIEVDDIDAVHARFVAHDWPIETPPGDRDWGKRDFRAHDPDGAYCRITTPEPRQAAATRTSN